MKYPQDFLNMIIHGDCVTVMKQMPDACVDLVVTSPPYDNLRHYNGYYLDVSSIAGELFRVVKSGGIVVWVVGDKIKHGNRSLTSFRQAIEFQELGFKVHDVMIYQKKNTPFMRSTAYTNCYELMLVLSKERAKTFNPIMVPTKRHGFEKLVANKGPDAINKKVLGELKKEKVKTNIWSYAVGLGGSTRDRIAFEHPAIFPETLAEDHILSWTNEGDVVLDPMCGSGTTCKMAKLNNRAYIGIDLSEEYCKISEERLSNVSQQLTLDYYSSS